MEKTKISNHIKLDSRYLIIKGTLNHGDNHRLAVGSYIPILSRAVVDMRARRLRLSYSKCAQTV